MTEIKFFNDSNVKQLRQELQEAINTVAAKYGLKATSLGNIGYDSSTLTTGKLSLAVGSSQPNCSETPLEDFVGKRFKAGSRTFTIIGVENGKLLGRTNRGARYLISRENLSTMIKL